MLRFIFALATLGELLLVASAQEDPLVLIVAGGYDGNFVEGVDDVETVELDVPPGTSACTQAQTSLPRRLASVFTIPDAEGRAMTCGGEMGDGCLVLMGEEWAEGVAPSTVMDRPSGPRAVLLSDGTDRWWITGAQGNIKSFSSEFYDPLFGNFTPGPRLPHPAHRHCAAEVSPGLVFLSGGIDDAFAERDEAYIFDVNDRTFQDLPPMPEAKYGHYCGVNRNPPSGRGVDIVVAGGSSETEAYVDSVFIYNTAEGFWRPGLERLPEAMRYGQSLPYGDTFLIVGGQGSEDSVSFSTIYEFNPATEGWTLREEELRVPRTDPGAAFVPRSAVECD